VGGCLATNYGQQPSNDPRAPDTFSFTIYKNTFASIFGEDLMNQKAETQIRQLMAQHGFTRYEILSVESHDLVAPRNVYRVKLFK